MSVEVFDALSLFTPCDIDRAKVTRTPSTTLYPATEDLGNNHVVHDHALLFYPFLPTTADPRETRDMIARIDRQRIPSV